MDDPKWQVLGQRETFYPNPLTNTVEQQVEVRFRLEGGTVGTVHVPIATYSVDAVRDAIDTYAAQLHAVNMLGGGPS